jgi:hypothetical protein
MRGEDMSAKKLILLDELNGCEIALECLKKDKEDMAVFHFLNRYFVQLHKHNAYINQPKAYKQAIYELMKSVAELKTALLLCNHKNQMCQDALARFVRRDTKFVDSFFNVADFLTFTKQ